MRRLGIAWLIGVSLLVVGCASIGRTGADQDALPGDAETSGDGSTVGDAGCVSPAALCDGDCVDLLSDSDHCGSCTTQCDLTTEMCLAGQCVFDCGAEYFCGGTCVDTSSDPQNCGECDLQCPTGINCVNGECIVHLDPSISGRVEYPNSTVLIDGDITVQPYNGSDDVTTCDPGETGCLHLVARRIEVASGGTIHAEGAGFGGGGGGGGAPGTTGTSFNCSHVCVSCSAGSGGAGHIGGGNGVNAILGDVQSISGGGGSGGGPHGGVAGAVVISSGSEGTKNGLGGGRGGYAGNGINGDNTTDMSLRLGSGGGGGSGGAAAYEPAYSSVGGSGGGGAGNRGGGYVILEATVEVLIAGTLSTAGRTALSGNGGGGTNGSHGGYTCDLEGSGGDGGNAAAAGSSAGGNGELGYFAAGWNECIERQCENNGSHSVSGGTGGAGGDGAGGGVLIIAPSVILSGTINALGGTATANGGTVKILHQSTAPSTTGVSAGRIYLTTY